MKNWRKVKQDFSKALSNQLGERETNAVFRLTIEKFTGNFPPTENDLESLLSEEQEREVNQILLCLKNNEPIQYILGYAWFYDLKLKVNSHVLIPRQETEELVHWITEHAGNLRQCRILDLGCGSGAIGLALAKFITNCDVIAGDISTKAVELASENAKRNHIKNIRFQQLDMLNLPSFDNKFDIIVSNPPYVSITHKAKMPVNVTQYEPNIAIFAPPDDELIFFNAIASFAKEHLKNHGHLFFEINENYKTELVELLTEKGFKNVEAKKDLNGNWRMLKAGI